MRQYKVGDIYLSIPSGHHETPWRMHRAVRKAAEEKDEQAIMQAITGATLAEFEGAGQFALLDAITQDFVSWFVKPMDKSAYSFSGTFRLGDATVRIPEQVQGMKSAAYFDAKAAIHNFELSELDRYEQVFKIIAYPGITGKSYNTKKAQALDIGDVLFPDVVLSVDFFLTVYASSRNGTANNVPLSPAPQRKHKPILKASGSSLGIWLGFSRWLTGVSGSWKRFWKRRSSSPTGPSSTVQPEQQQNDGTPQ